MSNKNCSFTTSANLVFPEWKKVITFLKLKQSATEDFSETGSNCKFEIDDLRNALVYKSRVSVSEKYVVWGINNVLILRYKLSLEFQKFTMVLFFKIFPIGLFCSKGKPFKFTLDALVHLCVCIISRTYDIQPIFNFLPCSC